jgi:hypothetical protein
MANRSDTSSGNKSANSHDDKSKVLRNNQLGDTKTVEIDGRHPLKLAAPQSMS